MVYTVADFDNPQVREAANPSTIGEWYYGPVPYTNVDWTPPEDKWLLSISMYRRYLCQSYSRASANPNTANISNTKLAASQNALKH
ncbi:hypothetical protein ETB97_009538 [Aspergillus alliaceus]|uniref:Uncharacterized protein n=1 Tax=Petromyces alliaceus TaxID=209559 RepID=A0A8H5ZT78_PETAA|nr:hypothetical protein ETB97_009538 [Aspergillus burnettii]